MSRPTVPDQPRRSIPASRSFRAPSPGSPSGSPMSVPARRTRRSAGSERGDPVTTGTPVITALW